MQSFLPFCTGTMAEVKKHSDEEKVLLQIAFNFMPLVREPVIPTNKPITG